MNCAMCNDSNVKLVRHVDGRLYCVLCIDTARALSSMKMFDALFRTLGLEKDDASKV